VMKSAILVLTQAERAVFPRTGATLGHHATLTAPTGSALLGWAARSYSEFKDPFRMFHSGKVRFSNACPLTSGGEIAFPGPANLLAQKAGQPASDAAGKLTQSAVWAGPSAYGDVNAGKQAEPVKPGWITSGGHIIKPVTGGRQRTATQGGRAKDGQLFGYDHIEADETLRFVAEIQADLDEGFDTNDWSLLKAAFSGADLRLGRSKNTFYGGAFRCEWSEEAGLPIWPARTMSERRDALIRVLALSPLALIDEEFGSPMVTPCGDIFGIVGGTLDRRESALQFRRFAPWNAALKARDVERLVIDAGSVLAFSGGTAAPGHSGGTTGAFREAGLGRYAIDPGIAVPGADGRPVLAAEPYARLARTTKPVSPKAEHVPSALAEWAAQMAETSADDALNAARSKVRSAAQKFPRSKSPTIGQWRTLSQKVSGASTGSLAAAVLSSIAGDHGSVNAPWGDPSKEETWAHAVIAIANDLDNNAKLRPAQRQWVMQQIADQRVRELKQAKAKT